MFYCRLMYATIALILSFSLSVANAASPLDLKGDGFTIRSKADAWCGQTVILVAESDSHELYAGDRIKLQVKGVGVARVAMSFTCAAVKKIILIGRSKGQLYFSGISESSNDWILEGIYAAPSTLRR